MHIGGKKGQFPSLRKQNFTVLLTQLTLVLWKKEKEKPNAPAVGERFHPKQNPSKHVIKPELSICAPAKYPLTCAVLAKKLQEHASNILCSPLQAEKWQCADESVLSHLWDTAGRDSSPGSMHSRFRRSEEYHSQLELRRECAIERTEGKNQDGR